ncbi:type II toxin-antitoxin system VapC family toxin [Methylomonas sp. LW13]|uniref:type II toxin-antitoxin system VapC family toxin n=1 Tax=unclassified Methylomonas TaxID=2608980 RepID=UPI00051B4379|nr:PIN domain-containing protein [Methylomonas sp. LW13]QBC26782.1 type II toxin-antitoxin system VapC family toxin [Methylomonas sp. LW13]
MKTVCVDNHILLWGIREEAGKEQEDMIPRAKAFFDDCQRSKIQIMVPSIVVGELLTAIEPKNHAMVLNLLKSSFLIPSYDAAASTVFAKLWRDNKSSGLTKELQNNHSATRQELKADCMIVAIAIVRKCNAIYSHDEKLKKFANGKIEVLEIPKIAYQEELEFVDSTGN